ncbi:hypothetical protein ES703_15118 [subsurface metagenome]
MRRLPGSALYASLPSLWLGLSGAPEKPVNTRLVGRPGTLRISEMISNIYDYIWWDNTRNRWDLTTLAIIEQTDPEVDALIKRVVRGWFIPIKPVQLPLENRAGTLRINEKGVRYETGESY